MEDDDQHAPDIASAAAPASPEVVARLVASHRELLAFLERRTPTRAAAEDILQAAFVKALEKGGAIADDESAVAWFYRVLRNALTDQYRHRDAEARMASALGHETTALSDVPPEPDERAAICGCLSTLLPLLPPQYGDILRRVDLDEEPLTHVAAELGITANNAGVRLHRARKALRDRLEQTCRTCATHGCLDCTCGASAGHAH